MPPAPLLRHLKALRATLLLIAGANFLLALLTRLLLPLPAEGTARTYLFGTHPVTAALGFAWLAFLLWTLLRGHNWARILLLVGAVFNLAAAALALWAVPLLLHIGLRDRIAGSLFGLVLTSGAFSVAAGVATARLLFRRDVAAWFGRRSVPDAFVRLEAAQHPDPWLLTAALAFLVYALCGANFSIDGTGRNLQWWTTLQDAREVGAYLVNYGLGVGLLVAALVGLGLRGRGLLVGLCLAVALSGDLYVHLVLPSHLGRIFDTPEYRLRVAAFITMTYAQVGVIAVLAYGTRHSVPPRALAVLVGAVSLSVGLMWLPALWHHGPLRLDRVALVSLFVLPSLALGSLCLVVRAPWTRPVALVLLILFALALVSSPYLRVAQGPTAASWPARTHVLLLLHNALAVTTSFPLGALAGYRAVQALVAPPAAAATPPEA